MEIIKLKDTIIEVLVDKKALDIKVLDLADQTVIADYFIIATGRSTTQLRALAENLEEKLEKEDVFVLRKEGIREGRWVVMDYGSVIVHLFNSENRDYYCLEKLWEKEGNIISIN